MIRELIVPIDGSEFSWRAFDVALALGARIGSAVKVLEVACDPVDGRYASERLAREVQLRAPHPVEVTTHVRLSSGAAGGEIATFATLTTGSVIVMASHGKGRSAAIVGSTTEDVLRRTFGPIVLVGRHVEPDDFSGPVLATVDGSRESEIALPLATSWATELRTTPWIVHVAPPTGRPIADDVIETTYPARLATDMAIFSGHAVEFDELHGRTAARSVAEYAARRDASLIVSSSHGRSGLSRLLLGSVVADLVRHATCPVAVIRLPHPVHAEDPERMWVF